MTEYMRWLAAERGARLRRLRTSSGTGRSTTSRPSGARSGTSSSVHSDGRRTTRPRLARDARRPLVRRDAELNYAEHVFRDRDDDERRDPPRLRAARARRDHLGRAARARSPRSPPACAPSASSAATASSPTCRTSPRRSSPSSPPPRSARSGPAARPTSAPRSVVDRFAQIEPKVLLAVDGYRYGGKDFDRLDVVAELQARDARASSTPSSSPTSTPSPTSPPSRDAIAWGELPRRRRGRRAHLRARPLRPPALGPLLLRHHRPAEGDRPGPGRDPARAPEEAPPPRRRSSAGDRVFWFTTTGWMMWNFLVSGLLTRGGDRALRRQPRPPRHGRPLGPRRATPGSPASAPAPPTSPPA